MKKRFPKAEMVDASKEVADGKTEYEVTVKDNGRKIDITLNSEGAISVMEKEIGEADLPEPGIVTIGHETKRGEGLSSGDFGDVMAELFVGSPTLTFSHEAPKFVVLKTAAFWLLLIAPPT